MYLIPPIFTLSSFNTLSFLMEMLITTPKGRFKFSVIDLVLFVVALLIIEVQPGSKFRLRHEIVTGKGTG